MKVNDLQGFLFLFMVVFTLISHPNITPQYILCPEGRTLCVVCVLCVALQSVLNNFACVINE